MGLIKRTYVDNSTVITAENMNEIQDAIIDLQTNMLVAEEYTHEAQIAASNRYVVSVTTTKEGYELLGIVGFDLKIKSDSSASYEYNSEGSGAVYITRLIPTGTNEFGLSLHNTHTTVMYFKLKVELLWKKIY